MLAGEPRITIPIAVTPMPTWIEVTFTHPVTLRSLDLPPVEKLAMKRMFDPATVVHVQTIGDSGLVEVARREIPRSNWQDNVTLTLALPETTAKGFRVTFENRRPLELSRLRFSSAARMDDWQAQAGFVLRSLDPGATPQQTPATRVPLAEIIDLGKHMQPDGRFAWPPPPGNWTVVRFGHVNSGEKNGPAPEEATGFECDKLSTAGADAHFAAYIGRIAAPFRADITPYVKRGANIIAVTVTNTWFNRLAYDAALPEAQRRTWSINAPAAGTPVEPAGLIGPVVLRLGQVVDLKQ